MQGKTQNPYPRFPNAPLLLKALDRGIQPIQKEAFSIEPFHLRAEHPLSFTYIHKLEKNEGPSQQSQMKLFVQLPIELNPISQTDEVRGLIRKSLHLPTRLLLKAFSFLSITSFSISIHIALRCSKEPKGIASTIEPSFLLPIPLGTNTFLEVALDSSTLLWIKETPRLLNLLDRIFHPLTNPLSLGNTKENLFSSTSLTMKSIYHPALLLCNSNKYHLSPPTQTFLKSSPSLSTLQVSTLSTSKANPFPPNLIQDMKFGPLSQIFPITFLWSP